jgi:CDP-diacylglycerol---glycerol-3-phosphate 3-phosphatidyltransferase
MIAVIRLLPNLLTGFRILLVPVFAWAALSIYPQTTGAFYALILFVVASITDFLDGYIARKANVISNFGKLMDPLADKILVITALFVLYLMPGRLAAAWVIFAVLVREVLVTVMRQIHASRGIYIPANWWGKAKAFLQMAGVIAALLYRSFPTYFGRFLPTERWELGLRIVFWMLALVTVVSGMSYMKPVWRNPK